VPRKRNGEADRTEKRDLLKRVALFRKLKEDELDLVVQYSGFAAYRDGEQIFAPGTNGESLFVVRRGRVRILAEKEGESRDIAEFIEGELFGELDLFEDAPRANGAVAESETVLLAFPRPGLDFASLLKKHPALFARILTKLLAQISQRLRETNKLVSEKTPWIDDLRRQLLYDKLTGLYNKSYLEEDFRVELARSRQPTSLLAIKPDNFKVVNDGYGHEAGDKALRLLADTVKAGIGGEGVGVRYRGDELMAVLPRRGEPEARRVAEQLLIDIKAIDLEPVINAKGVVLTAAIGVASYPAHAAAADELVAKAVADMFEARRAGGDRVW
jgi:diguanylate cyclase (GGDEF)-like protein